MEKKLIYLLTIAIILSEIAVLINAKVGVALYIFFISSFLFVISRLENIPGFLRAFIFILIVPVARFSLFFTNFKYNFVLFYGLILFMSIYFIFEFKIKPGFNKNKLIFIPLIIILAFVLGYFGSLFKVFLPSKYLYFIPVIAFSESLLFNGLIQNSLKEKSKLLSIILPALLFSVFNLNLGIYSVYLFLIWLISALIYNYTENLYLCAIFNIIFSLFYI